MPLVVNSPEVASCRAIALGGERYFQTEILSLASQNFSDQTVREAIAYLFSRRDDLPKVIRLAYSELEDIGMLNWKGP